jgi:hypothetical protein
MNALHVPRQRTPNPAHSPRTSTEDLGPLILPARPGYPAVVMALQRQIGNRATCALLSPRIQRVIVPPKDLAKAKQAYDAAILDHEKDKEALKKIVEDGLKNRATDRRLANSCEWIKQGKAKLYAATKTGDSRQRIGVAHMNKADDMALFPDGHLGKDDHIFGKANPTYKYTDLADNTGVHLDEGGKTTDGWNAPGVIAIYNARDSGKHPLADIQSTLRHEVQHDADRNRDQRTGKSQMEVNFIRYKTEYRAYNYQQMGYENLSMEKTVTKYGYNWKERQLAIFDHIWRDYDHTREFWDDSAKGQATPSSKGHPYDEATLDELQIDEIAERQQRIVDYVNPDVEGFNKWNSVRVDDFYNALMKIPDGTRNANAATVVALLKVCEQLRPEEKRYIHDESPDFQSLIKRKLTAGASFVVLAKLER